MRLALLDQAAFLRLRATGQGSIVQCTWVYDRDVDIDELRTFNGSLARGLLGRRIERSPLPFGRHRWVAGGRSPDIDLSATCPRDDIGAWIEQRARITVDPEWGPAYHIGVLPLDDGGAAISLVASHCVADGLGLATAIAEAVKGESREFGYPQPHSRGRWRAVSEDLTDAVRALPAVLRALIATLLILLRLTPDAKAPSTPPHRAQVGGDDDHAELPAVTMQTDAGAWDARARELSGSSNALCIAFAARVANRMGRVQPGGNTVTVVLPVSERTDDDDRANALSSITIAVDSEAVLDDLSRVRADVKNRLTSQAEQPNELLAGLPLIPFTPHWLVRHTEGIAMSTAQLPVGCSNLGSLDSVVARIDGGNATEVSMRLAEQGITNGRIECAHGQLFCGTGTVNGSRFLTVVAYQCGAENTVAWTHELARGALADLQLSATTVR
ncbi:MAG: hypothetical protein QOD39_442 [Mycobacterium sp.]|nr:hypothetical protein [Mycobacterium sp.]